MLCGCFLLKGQKEPFLFASEGVGLMGNTSLTSRVFTSRNSRLLGLNKSPPYTPISPRCPCPAATAGMSQSSASAVGKLQERGGCTVGEVTEMDEVCSPVEATRSIFD